MPEDGAFIGKCVCEGIGFEIFEKETDQNREIAERIAPLAALPRFRRQGVGSGLIKERIAQVQQEHPDLRITLLVDPENLNGQRIYSRLGFQFINRNVVAFNHLYWKMAL